MYRNKIITIILLSYIFLLISPGTVGEEIAISCNEPHINFTCNGDSLIYINKHESVVRMGYTRDEHCNDYDLNGGTLLNRHEEYLEGLIEQCNNETYCKYEIVNGLGHTDTYDCSGSRCHMKQEVAYFCFDPG